jgi:hypothetical protein
VTGVIHSPLTVPVRTVGALATRRALPTIRTAAVGPLEHIRAGATACHRAGLPSSSAPVRLQTIATTVALRSYWQRFASGELKPSSHERPKVIKLPPDGIQLLLIQHELAHRDARDYTLVQFLPTDIEYGRAVFAERVKAFQEATAAEATVDRLLESVAGSAVRCQRITLSVGPRSGVAASHGGERGQQPRRTCRGRGAEVVSESAASVPRVDDAARHFRPSAPRGRARHSSIARISCRSTSAVVPADFLYLDSPE